MKGRLQDMAVADLIQHNCQDRKTARIQLKNGRAKGELFFQNGNLIHASVDNQIGEEAVYQLMTWDMGTFELTTQLSSPPVTITRSWTSLLLEAARLVDEGSKNGISGEALTRTEESEEENERFVGTDKEFETAVSPQQMIEELSKKINGHRLTCLTQLRGNNLYWFSSADVDQEQMMGQINQFAKMVDTATTRLGAGSVRDLVLITEAAYLLVRFLGFATYYVLIVADKEKASIGNLRHLAGANAERLVASLKSVGAV